MTVRGVQREVILYISLTGKKNRAGSQKPSLRLSHATDFKLGFADSFSDLKKGLFTENPVWILSYISQSTNNLSANPAWLLSLKQYN